MERDKAKDLVIIGAGGFGREVKWLVERVNQFSEKIIREKVEFDRFY